MYDDASAATKLFATNLRYAAKVRGVTQLEIAIAVDAVKQSVNGWFQAYRMPNPAYMDKLAKFLQLPVSAFFDENGHCGADKPSEVRIPKISQDGVVSISPGTSSLIAIPRSLKEEINSTSTFMFTVPDDSMLPMFQEGDVLLCKNRDRAPNGSFVIALMHGKTCLRQYNISVDGSMVFFTPINVTKGLQTEVYRAEDKDVPDIIGIPFYLQRKV